MKKFAALLSLAVLSASVMAAPATKKAEDKVKSKAKVERTAPSKTTGQESALGGQTTDTAAPGAAAGVGGTAAGTTSVAPAAASATR